MTADLPELPLSVEHLHLTEPEAARLLEGRRLRRGERVMDPKAQIVGEVIRQLRPPDSVPTPEEARGQFRKMVELLDEPPPASVRVSDLTCPGPAGPIPLRLYTPDGGARGLCCCTSTAAAGCRAGWRPITAPAASSPPGPTAWFSPSITVWRPSTSFRPGSRTAWPPGAGSRPTPPRSAPTRRGWRSAATPRAAISPPRSARLSCACGEPAPAAQLLIYPSLDLGWQLPSHRDLADAYILPRIRVQWYTDLYLSSPEQAADVRASPLWAGDLHGQPAAMIVTAGFDPLLDDGRHYAERLEAAGTPVVYREFPGPDPRLHFPHARHPAGQPVPARGGELAALEARLTGRSGAVTAARSAG